MNTLRRPLALVLLPLWLLSAPVSAQPAGKPAEPPPAAAEDAPPPTAPAVGEATRQLLQRQREGTAANGPRALDGAMAEASYQRYLKSFEQPLPPWFGSRLESTAK